MSNYRYAGATGRPDEITVIEDTGMLVKDGDGKLSPGFQFIDSRTVKAHPFIIEVLIQDSERLWSMDEVLSELEGSRPS